MGGGKRGRTAPRERAAWLFEPEQLRLRPTGLARLRELARRPSSPPSQRERRRDEDERTIARLREWAGRLVSRFGLRRHALHAEREGVNSHYGICYEDGVILIRLRHARTGRLLKESSLVDTLCHELAHLRHFDHGPRFKRLYLEILDEARRLGFYRPGPVSRSGKPRQGLLFDDEEKSCGTSV